MLSVPLHAWAHHSRAAYDYAHPGEVTGTVKEFIWANPHCWIHLEVPNEQGGTDLWSLEGGGILGMVKAGWSKKVLQPGDKVRVLVAPYRDGRKGGQFQSVADAKGKIWKLY